MDFRDCSQDDSFSYGHFIYIVSKRLIRITLILCFLSFSKLTTNIFLQQMMPRTVLFDGQNESPQKIDGEINFSETKKEYPFKTVLIAHEICP